MPPHFIQVAGLDPVRDTGVIYERELRETHGTPTRITVLCWSSPCISDLFARNACVGEIQRGCGEWGRVAAEPASVRKIQDSHIILIILHARSTFFRGRMVTPP
jgi:acetyl esterase/lipase